MQITVVRLPPTATFTDGFMLLDGEFFGHTEEDPPRPDGQKIPGRTAIPKGRYKVTVEVSPHFSQKEGREVKLPRLHDVPGFDGVLIHGGNTSADSEGCILVASHRLRPGYIQGSLSLSLVQKLAQDPREHILEILESKP